MGIDELDYYCKNYQEVLTDVNLFPIDSPLNISADELAEVIEALNDSLVQNNLKNKPSINLKRTAYDEKNKINKLSNTYAAYMQKIWLPHDQFIRDFLSKPENESYAELLDDAASELQRHIVSFQNKEQSMDDIMNYVLDWSLRMSRELKSMKKILKALVYYMYFNCDIGTNVW